jgi:hypothetical protein
MSQIDEADYRPQLQTKFYWLDRREKNSFKLPRGFDPRGDFKVLD